MNTVLNQITITKEQIYSMTLDCYRSGQIDEARWQLHLSDPEFKSWFDKTTGEGK